VRFLFLHEGGGSDWWGRPVNEGYTLGAYAPHILWVSGSGVRWIRLK